VDLVSKRLLVVTRCAACPFFEDSPLKGGLLGILGSVLLADSHHGICCLLPSGEFLPSTDIRIGLPPGPQRYAKAKSRRFIEDKRAIPADCPLRRNDWTITLAGDN
jgi:hypothetical protein